MKKRILELNHAEARQFFLKSESYFNFDLPKYFVFQNIIDKISNYLTGKNLKSCLGSSTNGSGQPKTTYPSDFENVNYIFLNNKDGKFAWRPFQLIHPAIYVSLVHSITNEANWSLITARFSEFSTNPKIRCYSIPVESDKTQSDKATSVMGWWQDIEQKSLELALCYEYVLHADISDCYGSIYTHSVAWAIHSKQVAKDNKREYLFLGNIIDKHLQDMAFGQTNGIPQGSVLMDFIAEMVLGYADKELSERIQTTDIQDYEIIRYRDDYRIFSNNPQDSEFITKILTEILIELGMRLNAQKTLVSSNVIRDSIKPDKLYWISTRKETKGLQENLLLIHILSEKYPNSGRLIKTLGKFYKRIKSIKEIKGNIQVLVSILVDIMYKNPRTYPIASAILSKLLSLLNDPTKRDNLLQLISKRFDKIPNTGHIKIWLQRLTIKIDRQRIYEEDLCKKVNDNSIQIWNSDWLNPALKNLIRTTPIIEEQIISNIDLVINNKEVELFKTDYDNEGDF